MDRVAGSFGFPFRPGSARAWLIGIPLLVVLPIGAIPLLGYSVAIIRSAADDPEAGPPAWRPLGRVIRDGLWLALVLAGLSAPFALLAILLAGVAARILQPPVTDPFLAGALLWVTAAAVAALPWGILLLVLMPAAIVRFARSGSPRDLVDLPAALGLVRSRFGDWNLVVVAIVTAWALGLCGLGLVCLGIFPGVLYALLVSSHATSDLAE
ncbi:MAG TPA: DUF4013 domain-containing protein [Candidatus Dormibacteraeota bacterium]|nr:DUF4013 domain-containing protein [Candidatus Dormibacteraeota bacterium]